MVVWSRTHARHLASLLFGAALVVASAAGLARTIGVLPFVCPISKVAFEGEVEGSGTSFCTRFDLKQVGPIGAPGSIPVCPDHHLPLYKTFTDDELGVLTAWVASDTWKALLAESDFYRVARTMEHLGESPRKVGWMLVVASWEVEQDEERHHRYLQEAAEYLRRGLAAAGGDVPMTERATRWFVLADVRRRLGHFGAAERCLARLVEVDPEASVVPAVVVEREREYLAARDVRMHYIGGNDLDEERCYQADRVQQQEQQGRPWPDP